ncbi:zf-HC2 domain-containing protein [Nocardia sp. NBC_00511]|uniref:zf-HC2 domain-containing protein n=1 Tax=Nocardia sp. NBC_00511 TaxID=2903591 RepID=UPI0030DF110B
MRCDTAREAISARIDGEPSGIPTPRLQQHLDECPACHTWSTLAGLVTPQTGPVPATQELTGYPDLSDTIMNQPVPPSDNPSRGRRRPARLPNLVHAALAVEIGLLTGSAGFGLPAMLLAGILVAGLSLSAQLALSLFRAPAVSRPVRVPQRILPPRAVPGRLPLRVIAGLGGSESV